MRHLRGLRLHRNLPGPSQRPVSLLDRVGTLGRSVVRDRHHGPTRQRLHSLAISRGQCLRPGGSVGDMGQIPLPTPAQAPVDQGFLHFCPCGVTNHVTNRGDLAQVRPSVPNAAPAGGHLLRVLRPPQGRRPPGTCSRPVRTRDRDRLTASPAALLFPLTFPRVLEHVHERLIDVDHRVLITIHSQPSEACDRLPSAQDPTPGTGGVSTGTLPDARDAGGRTAWSPLRPTAASSLPPRDTAALREDNAARPGPAHRRTPSRGHRTRVAALYAPSGTELPQEIMAIAESRGLVDPTGSAFADRRDRASALTLPTTFRPVLLSSRSPLPQRHEERYSASLT